MDKYLTSFDSKELPVEEFDLVVIGAGLAGLSAAYSASEKGKGREIAVLAHSPMKESTSFNAQGGIAAAIGRNDSWKKHYKDTLKAGKGLCEKKNVEILTREGISRVKELIDLGLKFDSETGKGIVFGKEAAHSVNRILHIKGDGTGEGLIRFMHKIVKEKKNIHLLKENQLIDLLVKDGGMQGVLVKGRNGKKVIRANAFVLASGGYSALFEKTTNPKNSIGEGISIACRAGAKLADLEFTQFHPTTVRISGGKNFLISEAVRGEGAIIVNAKGERIMEGIDKRMELAPRDTVSRAIYDEMQKGKVFLDCRHLGKSFLKKRFPMIFEKTKSFGMDLWGELIPIEPAAHYSNGGIKTNSWGETSIKGLYASGECSCTGVHGANRLASNSLLEAIVFGFRSGENAVKEKEKGRPGEFRNKVKERKGKLSGKGLEKIMWKYCGIERNANGLRKGLKELKGIERKGRLDEGSKSREMQNKILLGKLVLESALKRKESRGGHYRTDYPKQNPLYKKHFTINK